MKKFTILFLCVFTITSVFAVPKNHKCPLCNGIMIWSGKSQTEWGKLVYEMKCPTGHTSWEVDDFNNSSSRSINKNGCQYDGNAMIWTGKTKIEWGKLLKEYKCPIGHIEWRSN